MDTFLEDSDKEYLGFRIVEMKGGNPHTLFHGIQGATRRTKRLNTGEWLEADVKVVNDGGRNYLSGFHFISNKKHFGGLHFISIKA